MNPHFRFTLGCLCVMQLSAASTVAQERIIYVADEYNKSVQPIYDEIDSLRSKLNDGNLSISEAAKIIEQQSVLRRKVDALWASTQSRIDKSYRDTRDAIVKYNLDNRQLEFDSAIAGSIADGLNNVAQFPTKEAFGANKVRMAAAWDQNYGARLKPFGEEFAKKKADFFSRYKQKYGVDLNTAGYSRIGEINPYTGEVYYKYYGTDGKLIAGQWQDDAQGYQKWKEDADAFRRRQLDIKEQLQRDTTVLRQFDGQFQQSVGTGQAILAALENDVARIQSDPGVAQQGRDRRPAKSIPVPPSSSGEQIILGRWIRRDDLGTRNASRNYYELRSGGNATSTLDFPDTTVRWAKDGSTVTITAAGRSRGVRGGNRFSHEYVYRFNGSDTMKLIRTNVYGSMMDGAEFAGRWDLIKTR